MTPELEQKIRAEIDRVRQHILTGPVEYVVGARYTLAALEWVLALAKPQEAAPSDDNAKIVEAMIDEYDNEGDPFETPTAAMRRAFAVARQHLIPQARAKALDDAADNLPTYDAGLLSGYGGGDVDWWQDYLRAELGRAHDFYVSALKLKDA